MRKEISRDKHNQSHTRSYVSLKNNKKKMLWEWVEQPMEVRRKRKSWENVNFCVTRQHFLCMSLSSYMKFQQYSRKQGNYTHLHPIMHPCVLVVMYAYICKPRAIIQDHPLAMNKHPKMCIHRCIYYSCKGHCISKISTFYLYPCPMPSSITTHFIFNLLARD